MKHLLSEPLLHFLAIGLILFGVYGLLNEDINLDSNQILIPQSLTDKLIFQWATQNGRPPTQDEKDGLLELFIQQEILYREALALGLEQGDVIVKRRLAQKMQYLFEDLSPAPEPDHDELKTYLELNAGQFRLPARLSFNHIYFKTDNGSSGVTNNTKKLLPLLNKGEADPASSGDRLLLPTSFHGVTENEIAKSFGKVFAANLFTLPRDQWVGPIVSGYGIHLVKIGEFSKAIMPPLAEIQDEVSQEWRYEKEKQLRKAFMEELRKKYNVEIEQDMQSTP
jgi:peptidyl-prolyl cis-trans isomerase C